MPKVKSNSRTFANGVPVSRGPSEPKKVLGITLSLKSSKALKRDVGVAATPPIAAVEQSQASTVRLENRQEGDAGRAKAKARDGDSGPRKLFGVTLSFKSSRSLKRRGGEDSRETGPVPDVMSADGQVLPQQVDHQPTFLYRGSRYLWGYTPDRQVCGMWDVEDPAGSPSQSWPIAEHAKAWAVFRSVEPLAVEYKVVGLSSSP